MKFANNVIDAEKKFTTNFDFSVPEKKKSDPISPLKQITPNQKEYVFQIGEWSMVVPSDIMNLSFSQIDQRTGSFRRLVKEMFSKNTFDLDRNNWGTTSEGHFIDLISIFLINVLREKELENSAAIPDSIPFPMPPPFGKTPCTQFPNLYQGEMGMKKVVGTPQTDKTLSKVCQLPHKVGAWHKRRIGSCPFQTKGM